MLSGRPTLWIHLLFSSLLSVISFTFSQRTCVCACKCVCWCECACLKLCGTCWYILYIYFGFIFLFSFIQAPYSWPSSSGTSACTSLSLLASRNSLLATGYSLFAANLSPSSRSLAQRLPDCRTADCLRVLDSDTKSATITLISARKMT